eukprot:CAMPEP_0203745716 /NCGR_PEP_ID=MMETSP0098-20131031/1371_1 /ASSEMBLY_ACC=CAM_ASM_000208 /TAXON_ID=96639 /ORGANISM=" , Strain NY0313808BC1" /LENGTH=831 /DNA_ID=CAMNT_0050633577 /DNA_START=601 /DNA_END=3097 /DNA_ORIENTATION=-
MKKIYWVFFGVILSVLLCDSNGKKGTTPVIDVDGDGAISGEELFKSKFFQSADSNGDGTIEDTEIQGYLSRFGADKLYKENSDLVQGIDDAVFAVDQDNTAGIQVGDLIRHWEKLDSLVTVDDVEDWITNAVLLPQYAIAFKENGIKGLDLPLFVEEPSYLEYIGVKSPLHRKQILRSISMRLFGLGKSPLKPTLSCDDVSREGKTILTWSSPIASRSRVLRVHKWRLMWSEDGDSWVEVGSYAGDSRHADTEGFEGGTFRLEAWNAVGKSDFSFCTPGSLKKRFGRSLFTVADKDGDGDIDSTELKELVSGLSDELGPGKKDEMDFLSNEGVRIGMDRIDGNNDNVILPTELETHWKGLQSLMTVEHTISWLDNAVGLAKYVPIFKKHGVTGFDLMRLIADGGKELSEIGITDERDKRLLIRAVTVLFLGVGHAPSQFPDLDVKTGVKCGSIDLKWGAQRHLHPLINEMPIHKYRVLRQERSQEGWVVIYSGMGVTFTDENLTAGSMYNYRVEAWNLLGVSPVSQSDLVLANSTACVYASQWIACVVWAILMFPFYLVNWLIDNYYRITAILSVVGFGIMLGNVPLHEKKRMLESLRDRVSIVIDRTFGSTLGVDRCLNYFVKLFLSSDISSDVSKNTKEATTPLSPHHDMINRAVEATFPSGIRPVNSLGSRQPSDIDTSVTGFPSNPSSGRSLKSVKSFTSRRSSGSPRARKSSKWAIVRRHVTKQRVLKAWTRSTDVPEYDTDGSSVVSLTDNQDTSPAKPRFPNPFRRKRSSLSPEPFDSASHELGQQQVYANASIVKEQSRGSPDMCVVVVMVYFVKSIPPIDLT